MVYLGNYCLNRVCYTYDSFQDLETQERIKSPYLEPSWSLFGSYMGWSRGVCACPHTGEKVFIRGFVNY